MRRQRNPCPSGTNGELEPKQNVDGISLISFFGFPLAEDRQNPVWTFLANLKVLGAYTPLSKSLPLIGDRNTRRRVYGIENYVGVDC